MRLLTHPVRAPLGCGPCPYKKHSSRSAPCKKFYERPFIFWIGHSSQALPCAAYMPIVYITFHIVRWPYVHVHVIIAYV